MYKLNDRHEIYCLVAKTRAKALRKMANAVEKLERKGVVVSSTVIPFQDGDDFLFEGTIIVDNSAGPLYN